MNKTMMFVKIHRQYIYGIYVKGLEKPPDQSRFPLNEHEAPRAHILKR